MSGGVDIERLLIQGPTQKELAEALADAQKQLADLKRERAWHLTAERPPTLDDADDTGFVWTFTIGWQIHFEKGWALVAGNPDVYPVWCKTPGSMPPEIRAKITDKPTKPRRRKT